MNFADALRIQDEARDAIAARFAGTDPEESEAETVELPGYTAEEAELLQDRADKGDPTATALIEAAIEDLGGGEKPAPTQKGDTGAKGGGGRVFTVAEIFNRELSRTAGIGRFRQTRSRVRVVGTNTDDAT